MAIKSVNKSTWNIHLNDHDLICEQKDGTSTMQNDASEQCKSHVINSGVFILT